MTTSSSLYDYKHLLFVLYNSISKSKLQAAKDYNLLVSIDPSKEEAYERRNETAHALSNYADPLCSTMCPLCASCAPGGIIETPSIQGLWCEDSCALCGRCGDRTNASHPRRKHKRRKHLNANGIKYDRNCFFSPVQCDFSAYKDKSFSPELIGLN